MVFHALCCRNRIVHAVVRFLYTVVGSMFVSYVLCLTLWIMICTLLAAEKYPNIRLHFHNKLQSADLDEGSLNFVK